MDKEEKDKVLKFFKLWDDFKNKIVYESRYFLKHEVLDLLLEQSTKNQKELLPSTTYYRARLFNENNILNIDELKKEIQSDEPKKTEESDPAKRFYEVYYKNIILKKEDEKYKSDFWGYSKGENLMPPPDIDVDNGRANPQFIRYLYIADSKYTALAEARPRIGDKISIAEIICNEKKKIADLSYSAFNPNSSDIDILLYFIVQEFSAINNGGLKQYIPTQYVIEFLKHNGFDGVKYNSSLHKGGRNFVFFNEKGFEDLNSRVYELDNIQLYAKCANSSEEPGIQPSIPFVKGLLPRKK